MKIFIPTSLPSIKAYFFAVTVLAFDIITVSFMQMKSKQISTPYIDL